MGDDPEQPGERLPDIASAASGRTTWSGRSRTTGAALTVCTREAFPADWATTQNNLAIAYRDRIRGERADNLERAIAHYDAALTVYTREAFPEQWAMTQNNLAIAYRDRIRGERADNLEQAIAHYEQALTVYTREAFPADWAATQNNLAAAYWDRIRGERADNLERAIEHYEQALTVCTREAFPERLGDDPEQPGGRLPGPHPRRAGGQPGAGDRALRAGAHGLHPRGLPGGLGDDPEQSGGSPTPTASAASGRTTWSGRSSTASEALTVCTREAFPADWAMTQNNLANAYGDRIRGERADNLERAIEHYEQALTVRTREAFPADWAMTQNNLAAAYCDRIRGERADNLERAIEHLRRGAHGLYPRGLPRGLGGDPEQPGDRLPTASAASGRTTWSGRSSTASRRSRSAPARPSRRTGR